MTQEAHAIAPDIASASSPIDATTAPSRETIDVSALPTYAFGKRDPLYWGALTLVAIEGMSILIVYFSLLYVRQRVIGWPLAAPTPLGTWLSAGIVLTLSISAFPNWALSRAAQRGALRPMQMQMALLSGLGVAACVLRGLEFAALPFRWDAHIYGSLFWAALVLNTVHLAGEALENLVFLGLLFKGPIQQKHLADLTANSVYWYFVVLSWIPQFCLLYLEPALLLARQP